MGWSEILNIVFGGTSLASIVMFFIYFKENKRLKQNEVKNSDTATQKDQIDLGKKFIEESLSMLEMIKKSQENGNENQERMLKKLDALTEQGDDHSKKLDRQDERADAMETLLGYVVRYLNGGLQSFIDQQKKGGKES